MHEASWARESRLELIGRGLGEGAEANCVKRKEIVGGAGADYMRRETVGRGRS